MKRSKTSTPQLAGLAVLALTAAALAVPMTSAVPASAQDEPSSLAAANDKVARWIAKHEGKVKLAEQDKLVRAATLQGGNGTVAVAYERLHQGLPVIGGDFVVVTGATGAVLNTEVAQTAPVDVASITPTLTQDRAVEISREQVDSVSGVEATTLVIWQDGATSRLAYETTVSGVDGGEASRQSVYVDAQDGAVLGTKEHVVHGSGTAAYSGPNPLPIATTLTSGTYRMTDPTAPSLTCQDQATNVTFSGSDDLWGNGNATNKETGCVDGLYAAQQMKGMMSSWLGRNGMDGNGGWVPMRVGLNDQNAFYDGTQTQYGKNTVGQWITSIDVVAHEYGHGVDDKTPGGISGGGTQEFIGDALATATEYYDNQDPAFDGPDHTIGEEINLVGQGPIRDGSNPANAGDPSCWTTSIPTMGVHAAAGPGDHWFYLLSRGGVSKCDGTSVTGMGEQAAIKVLYNAMLMKTSTSSYLKYRTWTLQAAKNLDSTCAQFNKVKTAWDAVNVPAQTADPTCGTTPPPPPPPGGNLLANPGFESGVASWTGTSGVITSSTGRPARTGSWKAWLGGNGVTSTENLSQTVTIPATATAANLSYWIRTDTAETGSTVYDTMRVQIVVGGVTTTLRTFSNVGTNSTYTQFSHSLLAHKGKAVTVKLLMNEDSSLQTSFVVDDTAVSVS
ncbi:M4 family metallopeptidase [Nocardioides sp.]|uniref:M4 family metallopeptidase n=1 Tax=Nocardioides sp. TaxID=35761 RepID=UPI002C63C4C2|nr:M4 family metallopeptidase [Nocardioides sp.]HXH81218.1 M4 family metallopeptidase [Nocardioides sp.]